MNIHGITIDVADPGEVPAAESFYRTALDVGDRVGVRIATEPSSGFRGFAPSLILMQPADVDAAFARALNHGARTLKPVAKSLWGYGGSLLSPDGTAWQIASANKTNTGPATGQVERLVLLLGVDDVKAGKSFYEAQDLKVAKSFGSKYVEFDSGAIKLALYKRAALAKQVGIDPAGTGSHRLAITCDAAFTDPDGYSWAAADTAVNSQPRTTAG
jgi:predicted lactoylglutathione lyase